jgi:hypothetical protein
MLTIDLNFFESIRELPLEQRMMKASIWYAKQGFKVIPVPKGTKSLGVPEQQASSDIATIKEWYGVHFVGGNIRLLLQEQDISVLDADRHGEIDGFKNAGLVEADFTGLVATTPHNGLHLYILGNTALKRLPKGIEHKTTSVVVPPSVVDGVAYEWRTGGCPGPLPPALATKLRGMKLVSSNATPLAPPNRSEIYGQASEQSYTPTPVAPIGYVKRLLEHMDPGADYDEWSKVGMAMHHNDDSELSMETWCEWSMNSAKYKAGECEKKWVSFSQYKSNPITLRWLILTAKQNGCPDSPEDAIYYGASLALDMEVESMNKTYNYRLMKSTFRICWLKKDAQGNVEFYQYKEQDFKSWMQNKFIMAGTKWLPAADVWLHSPFRRSGEVNMWEIGKEPPNAMNLYQGLAVEPVACDKSEISFFLDFTLDVICRGNKEYQHYLLDLLAFKVQHPLKLSGICLVLQGGEGTGKGSLCRIMETIMGKFHAMAVSDRRALVGEYNGMLIANALWVTANEAFWAGAPGEAERLKAMITEPNLDWNEKFIPMWSQRNCIQLTITTNNKWAVPADVDSRRFFVLRMSDDKAKDEAYWNEFNALLGRDEETWRPTNPEYMGKVLYYLQQRKIISSFVNALETVWLMEQRGQTILGSDEDAFISWLRLFLQENSGDVYIGRSGKYNFSVVQYKGENYVLSANFWDDYREFVERNFRRRKPLTNDVFNDKLRDLGITIIRVKPSPDDLEAAITAKYKLLTADIEDAED